MHLFIVRAGLTFSLLYSVLNNSHTAFNQESRSCLEGEGKEDERGQRGREEEVGEGRREGGREGWREGILDHDYKLRQLYVAIQKQHDWFCSNSNREQRKLKFCVRNHKLPGTFLQWRVTFRATWVKSC